MCFNVSYNKSYEAFEVGEQIEVEWDDDWFLARIESKDNAGEQYWVHYSSKL